MNKNGGKRYVLDLTTTKIDRSTMLGELKTAATRRWLGGSLAIMFGIAAIKLLTSKN